jgi:hypothetical protein
MFNHFKASDKFIFIILVIIQTIFLNFTLFIKINVKVLHILLDITNIITISAIIILIIINYITLVFYSKFITH